jgi:hypothetical protein
MIVVTIVIEQHVLAISDTLWTTDTVQFPLCVYSMLVVLVYYEAVRSGASFESFSAFIQFL